MSENIRDIAKKIKGILNKKYPFYVFSVSSEIGMTDSLYIKWLSADFYPFLQQGVEEHNVNSYHIDRESQIFNSKGFEVVKDIYNIANQFQTTWERGDNHISRKFYLNIGVGRYDKPFTVIEKTGSKKYGTSTKSSKGWEWGELLGADAGWGFYKKTLPDGRIVYNVVKDKSTPPNKEKWNEIRGDLYTQTGFKWSPKTQSFQYWGSLADENLMQLAVFKILAMYYTQTEPKAEPNITQEPTKKDLTDKTDYVAFDIVYAENKDDFEQSDDFQPFFKRMALKYLMRHEQWAYLLKQFNEKNDKPFVLNESYKSIPDNPKLEYVKINGSEGYPEYTSLFPLTFGSFKQMNKFIADNLDIELNGGYDKHWIEWKWKFEDKVYTDRYDIGKSLNPNEWSNIWAREYLQGVVWDALTSSSEFTKEEYEKSDADLERIGKDGLELTKDDFYQIIDYLVGMSYYNEKYFPKYTTFESRLQRLKSVYPKLFSIFDADEQPTVSPEMIEKQIKILSILAKGGDKLAAQKIKVLQILLKK